MHISFRGVFFSVSLFLGGWAQAQLSVPVAGVPGTGSSPVIVSVEQLLELDRQAPPETGIKVREELKAGNRFKIPAPDALPGYNYPMSTQPEMGLLNVTQGIHSNFQGIQITESGSIPPDCMGAVSHTQVCVVSNGRIKWYPKPTVCDAPVVTSTTTNTGSLANPSFSTSLRTFFSTVIGTADVTDPHVYFDRLSERWFVVAINTANASNRIMIAVSNTANVAAGSTFSFYFFNHDNGAPTGNADRGGFCDYPMPGLDRHALYIGGIIFNSSGNFIGSSVYVVNKATLLSGGTLQFNALRQAGLVNSGIFAPQGVYNDDPEATRGFFMGVDNEVFSRLRYIVVNNPGSATPTFQQATLSVPATYYPYKQPAAGSNVPLDALGDERLLDAQMVRNKLTGQYSIWTAHHIAVTAAGTAVTADGVSGARNAMRWYQLGENNGVLTLSQAGTLFDNAGSNPRGYWMGTIMGTGQGHAVLSSSIAAPNLHANAIVAGRYAAQNAGTLNPPVNATNFTEVYNRETSGDEQRWGDYTHTVVDPSDDMTVWTFQQYTNSPNNWAVRAIQLKAPPPAVPVSVGTISCDANKQATITLTGQATDFAGFFDPGPPRGGGPAYPRRLGVSSTGNVGITAVELVSPTQIRFVANFSNATLGSQQTLTVTNPDCQSVMFNYTIPATCGGGGGGNPGSGLRVNANPAVGNMVVTLPAGNGELRLVASDGKVVDRFRITATTLTINTGKYATGVYYLEHTGASGSETLTILIQRK